MTRTTGVCLLTIALLILTGCGLYLDPPLEQGGDREDPPPETQEWLMGRQTIHAGGSSNRAIAEVELWMDGDPLHPRIVLAARETLALYELHLTLPDCYDFPRPDGGMPGWQGTQLAAGERVQIRSEWLRIRETCDSPFATLLWQIAASAGGSRDRMSVRWEPPQPGTPRPAKGIRSP